MVHNNVHPAMLTHGVAADLRSALNAQLAVLALPPMVLA